MFRKTWGSVGVRLAAAGLLVTLAGGCIESTTLLTLNTDGSGTLTIIEYFSPQLTGMMDGMGDMLQGMASGVATNLGASAQPPPGEAKKESFFAQTARTKAGKLGTGVRQVDFAEKTNAQGWKGYRATYAFADINKLQVELGGSEAGGADGGKSEAKSDSRYTSRFQPGPVASLDIVPVKPDISAEQPPEAPGSDAMGDSMMQMMAPALKGMRLSFLVQVNGKIVETNSRYRSAKNPNVFTVMDMPVDRLLENKDAAKLMASKKTEDRTRIAAMNVAGVRMEDPAKTLGVKFQ